MRREKFRPPEGREAKALFSSATCFDELSPGALVRETIRGEIVDGTLAPGSAVPPHLRLAERFGVSNVTIRQALSQLSGEGFLDVRPRVGTFVSPRPPHLCRYGLVFWNDPAAPLGRFSWSRYFQALTQAALQFEQETGLRVLQYHGIDHHTDTPDRQRLIEDMACHRVAGVIFANAPFMLEGSEVLELPGVPRVALEARSETPLVHAVGFDYRDWFCEALDYLSRRGCRRVAMIALLKPRSEFDYDWVSGLVGERGMVTAKRWLQYTGFQNPEAVRHLVQVLMHDREPPDALLIPDDNLVEPVLAGLGDARVGIPAELAVVGHANLPIPPATSQPVRLLGFDMRQTFEACVEIVDRWRAGRPPAGRTMLPPFWQGELTAAETAPRMMAASAAGR